MTDVRRVLAVAGTLLLAAACAGGGAEGPTPPPTPSDTAATGTPAPSPTVSPSPSPSPSLTTEIALQLPADAPTTLDQPLSTADIGDQGFGMLAPPGATVTATSMLVTPEDPVDQIAIAWRRGENPFASEQGLVVWQPFGSAPRWRALYAFTDRPSKGTLGIDVDAGDLTDDGIPDLLTFEQQGGTGACGTWRVIASAAGAASEVFREQTCDTQVQIADGGLAVREAVFGPNDPHCCPSAFRVSRLEWDGRDFVKTHSEVVGSPS